MSRATKSKDSQLGHINKRRNILKNEILKFSSQRSRMLPEFSLTDSKLSF